MHRIFIFIFLILGTVQEVFTQDNGLENILNKIIELLSVRDFSSALEQFDGMPYEEAGKNEILIMKASILNSAGRTEEAKKIANDIMAKDRNNTEALMILADTAAVEGKERDRRNLLERIIALNSGHARALNDLGNLALENRNLYVAAGYFDRALIAEPNNGEALVSRAVVHRYNNEPGMSEQLLNRAINLYPGWARSYQERARLYKGAGFLDDAIEDLDFAKKLEPDNYWIIIDRGLVLMDMDRKQEALDDFSFAIEINPDIFLAYAYSAGIKDELGDYKGAEEDYVKLTRLKPDYYFAYEALGIIKMRNKMWADARDAFLEAYKQAPREYTYALLAAVCWMRAGRQADPRQFLSQVLRTAPRDSLEYSVLRMFHDLGGDANVAANIENEKNIYTKARMLFYLASYYDIRGSRTLADRYYLMVQELDAVATIEWRLNEIILAEKGIGLRKNNE